MIQGVLRNWRVWVQINTFLPQVCLLLDLWVQILRINMRFIKNRWCNCTYCTHANDPPGMNSAIIDTIRPYTLDLCVMFRQMSIVLILVYIHLRISYQCLLICKVHPAEWSREEWLKSDSNNKELRFSVVNVPRTDFLENTSAITFLYRGEMGTALFKNHTK